MKRIIFITLLVFTFSNSFSQIPHTISYQGILTGTDGSLVKDGMVSLKFRLYNTPNGGDTLWQESQNVMVTKGIFNVILGSKTTLNLPFDEQYWLGVSVEDGNELSPRAALTASPYSLNSHSTIAETNPGQELIIRNSSGGTTHELKANGDVTHTGTGIFMGAMISGDTTNVFDDTLFVPDTSKAIQNMSLKKNRIDKTSGGVTLKASVVGTGTDIGVYGNGKSIGVTGRSDKGWGVEGRSVAGIGVLGTSEGYNPNGYGIEGYSKQNFGIYGHSHFSVGLVGKTLSSTLPAIWSQGKLKIDNVPEIQDQDRFLVWDTDNIVKYRTLPSAFDGILQDKAFVVRNGDTEVFRVDTNGNSYHKGIETFDDDVILKGGRGKGIKLVDPNGTTLAGFGRNDLDTGQRLGVYGRAQQPGDLAGAFDGDVDIRGEITTNSLHIVNTNGDTLTDFFDDGTSLHKGMETYQAGLKVTNTDGSSAIELVPNTNPQTEYGVRVNGNVMVNGIVNASVIQAEVKQFRIDYPLDPEHKYLNHTSVESSEMKNVYDGEVVLDRNGEAVVSLPEWFQALNKDYRYQLTCIGGYAPVYIKEEIKNNQFKIAGGQEGLKICWLVTGVRNDKFAREHRMKVITDK